MRMAVMTVALLLAPLCLAQPVYRCQEAAGISYQDHPCAEGGEVLALQAHRPSAREVARTERRQLEVRRFLRLAQLRRIEATPAMLPEPALLHAATRPAAEPAREGVKVIVLLSAGRHVDDRRMFDKHRFDRHRFDRHRFDRHRFDRHRFDRHPFDRHQGGRHWNGHPTDDRRMFDRHRFDRHRFDRHRFDGHQFDRHRFDRHRFDGHQFDRHRFGKHRFDRHRRGVVICPLGLVNCKKVWRGTSFRLQRPQPGYRSLGSDRGR